MGIWVFLKKKRKMWTYCTILFSLRVVWFTPTSWRITETLYLLHSDCICRSPGHLLALKQIDEWRWSFVCEQEFTLLLGSGLWTCDNFWWVSGMAATSSSPPRSSGLFRVTQAAVVFEEGSCMSDLLCKLSCEKNLLHKKLVLTQWCLLL